MPDAPPGAANCILPHPNLLEPLGGALNFLRQLFDLGRLVDDIERENVAVGLAELELEGLCEAGKLQGIVFRLVKVSLRERALLFR